MEIRPIKNQQDYDWALKEVEQYFINEPDPGTLAADRFDVLSTLIDAYETNNWAIDAADPVEVIRHIMEAKGLKQSDLAALLGSKSRASELLAKRRRLTLHQAGLLHTKWGVPAHILLKEAARKGKTQPRVTQAKKGKTVARSKIAA